MSATDQDGSLTGPLGVPSERPPASARVGQHLHQYKIQALLGSGGMGEVFRAEDTRLQRTVAVKVISTQRMDSARARERFMQEARSASALDHPNICTIHEIGETPQGELFLVMALCDGPTLSELMLQRALDLGQSLDYCRQLLEGLAAAHDAGVVHRDVKPGNLIITRRGVLKIVDFGLAKINAPSASGSDDHTEARMTRPGMVFGTAAYMSPEQCRGDNVDHRTDIWAAGVTLYEMLTGRLPFPLSDSVAQRYAICHQDAPALDTRASEAAPYLQAILDRALAKAPDRRFASARDFLRELGTVPSAPPSVVSASAPPSVAVPVEPDKRSLIVLPFVNLSPDKAETDYFVDGLTDEIITELSRLDTLRVTSRTSAMRLRDSDKDIREIGKAMDVRFVLEGTARKIGDELRVTAKLIDAARDTPLWAERFSGHVEDVFEIQEKISQQIVAALSLKLSSSEERKLHVRPITNVQAWDAYLRARQEIFRFTPDALQRALEHIERGISIGGENALLVGAQGYVCWQMVNAGVSRDRTYLDKARACALRALELDPESPHGHRLLGLTALKGGTIQEVVRHLKRALAKDPNDTDSLFWISVMYGFAGHAEAGTPLADRLLKIDPLTPMHNVLPGFLGLMGGDFPQGPEWFARASAMEPGNPVMRVTLGQFLALNGRVDEACAVFDQLWADMPGVFFALVARAYKAALQGDRAGVIENITLEVKQLARDDGQYSWSLSECFALVGETAMSLDWMANAIDHGCWNYPMLAEWDPLLASVRNEPGFKKMMGELKPVWEKFEV